MASQWDQPETAASGPAAETRRDGLFDPLAAVGFLFANLVRIGVIAAMIAAAGIVLFSFVPFPYRATATVLVDPRSEQVTLQPDVLSSIGSDAAILESMVQIMKSDGFLLGVMKNANLLPAGVQADELKALAKLKSDLVVERKGATYLVEVSYKAANAGEAASVANAVAEEFARTQNGYLSEATENATRALSERLIDLRRKLDQSEKAVADYAAQRGIVYVDANQTLQRRQLSELSAQLAAAKTAADEARARYQRQVAGGDAVVPSTGNAQEPAQLTFLRQQRTQLQQTLQQQSLTYGARHPRMAETRRLLAGIEQQVRDEKALLARQLKDALDIAEAQQAKLQSDITGLSSGVATGEADEVRLEALRREAAADRDIYQQFLSRNKATDELAALKSDNVRVVSPAVPPLKSSRPPLALVAPLLAILGVGAAVIGVASSERSRQRRRLRVATRATPPLAPEPAKVPETPLRAPRPASTSLLMMDRAPRSPQREIA